MLGVDSEFGASILRLWLAAGSAVLLVLFCVLALFQPQLFLASSPARRAGLVVIGAILGGVMAWGLLDRPTSMDRAGERRVLELRAEQLGAQALAPGSPLACLDGLAGESVEAACEKSVFASAASVAAASSYAAAKLTLLAGVTAYVQHGGTDVDDLLAQLRRTLEVDRFGFVAHVLAVRDHCTSDHCKPLALLKDATQIRANLGADKLGRYLEHYAAAWSTAAEVAEAAPVPPPTHKPVNIDFPSAASIPAVNIMNPEPTGPILPGAAAAAAANPNPPAAGTGSSSRHSRKQQAPSNTASTAAPPAAAPGNAAVEPIWPQPVPPPPSTPVPQATASPPAAPSAPVQLTPSNVSAGTGSRTQ